MQFICTMRHFRKDIRISLKLIDFSDEKPGNEKLIELLGHYRLDSLVMRGCFLNLRASCMFLLQPPKTLHCHSGFINFQKVNQVIAAEDLRITNTRVYCNYSNDRLFQNA